MLHDTGSVLILLGESFVSCYALFVDYQSQGYTDRRAVLFGYVFLVDTIRFVPNLDGDVEYHDDSAGYRGRAG